MRWQPVNNNLPSLQECELQETDVFRLAEAMVAGHRQLLDELRGVFQRLPNTVERARIS